MGRWRTALDVFMHRDPVFVGWPESDMVYRVKASGLSGLEE